MTDVSEARARRDFPLPSRHEAWGTNAGRGRPRSCCSDVRAAIGAPRAYGIASGKASDLFPVPRTTDARVAHAPPADMNPDTSRRGGRPSTARGGPLPRPPIPFRHPFRAEASQGRAVDLERRIPAPRCQVGPRHRIPHWGRDGSIVREDLRPGIKWGQPWLLGLFQPPGVYPWSRVVGGSDADAGVQGQIVRLFASPIGAIPRTCRRRQKEPSCQGPTRI